jgi:hypothetical protein
VFRTSSNVVEVSGDQALDSRPGGRCVACGLRRTTAYSDSDFADRNSNPFAYSHTTGDGHPSPDQHSNQVAYRYLASNIYVHAYRHADTYQHANSADKHPNEYGRAGYQHTDEDACPGYAYQYGRCNGHADPSILSDGDPNATTADTHATCHPQWAHCLRSRDEHLCHTSRRQRNDSPDLPSL